MPNGITLLAEVGLCVFMYPGYPLQLTVNIQQNGELLEGNATVADSSLHAKTATPADVTRLLATVRTMPCTRCSAVAFDPNTVKTNRGGLCESCFVADLNAELAEELAIENCRIAQRDKRMKCKGMKYRVVAWVHPDEGDDYCVEWYSASKPMRQSVRAYLKQQRSAVLDDFEIVTL
jgi:hypothetical protein